MEFWLAFLPIIIYLLIIALLIIGIVLGIRTIITIEKIEKVVDNVNEKVESLNSVFSIIDFATDKLSHLTDKVVDVTSSIFGKLFSGKKKKKIKEDDI